MCCIFNTKVLNLFIKTDDMMKKLEIYFASLLDLRLDQCQDNISKKHKMKLIEKGRKTK